MSDVSQASTDAPAKGDAKVKAKWLLDVLSIDLSSIAGKNFADNQKKLAEKLALDRKGLDEADYQEDRAQRILTGMEKTTQANQRAKMPGAAASESGEPAKDDGPPLAHALGAHGPGKDQTDRLINGRRADQVSDEKQNREKATADLQKKQESLTARLEKATKGEPGAEDLESLKAEQQKLDLEKKQLLATSEITTVGKDPSNISGTFTDHAAMLDAVREGFAQANMVEQFGNKERAGKVDTTLGESRFVTKVKGIEGSGKSYEVKDAVAQRKGASLGKDEQEARKSAIAKPTDVSNASVVLDPSYAVDDKGEYILDKKGNKQRTGWNLQTAYPVKSEPDKVYGKPDDVKGSRHDLEGQLKAEEKKVEPLQQKLDEARKQLKGKNDEIAAVAAAIKSIEKEIADAKIPKGETTETLKKQVKDLEQKLKALDSDDEDAPIDFDNFGSEPAAKEEDPEIVRQRKTLTETKAKTEAWLKASQKSIELNIQKAKLPPLEQARTEAKSKVEGALLEVKDASKTAVALKLEIQSKSPGQGGDGKLTGCYDPLKGEITDNRPEKPASLRGRDEEGDSLTANHLYPWNKIRDDINKALKSGSQADLQKVLDFGKYKVDASFWQEFAKPAGERNHSFSETMNRAAQAICWAPDNVFLGPISDKRGDDPGEKRDAAFTKSGLPTPESAMAEMIDKKGGIAGKRTGAAAVFEKNLREAQEGEKPKARDYDPKEWEPDQYGKLVRRQGPDKAKIK
jgi:hypothetical protein